VRLAKRTIRGSEYRHPLFKLSLMPGAEENVPALLVRLRAGETQARNDAILGYVNLSMSIVGRYIAVMRSDRLANDMVSAAMEGIVTAVDKVVNGEMTHENLTGYVTACVHRFISAELERRQVVRVPHQTISKRRQAGLEPPPKPVRVDMSDPAVLRKVARSGEELDFEIREILDRVLQNDLEKSIIELRQQGMTDQQVADELDLSKTAVFVIRKGIETRFLELFYA
jgi:hypothetical protein